MGSLLLHREARHSPFLLSSVALLVLGTFALQCSILSCLIEARPHPSPSPITSSTQNCTQLSEKTQGPFWIEENIETSNVRLNLSYGLPLNITFKLVNSTLSSLAGTCVPIRSARIDIWQARYDGLYSDVKQTVGQTWLRGFQHTNSTGCATFHTIYPGWYRSRTVHIHARVRIFDGKTITYEKTTQLYFDDAVSDAVFANVYPYNARASEVRDTYNTNDSLFTSDNVITLHGNYSNSAGYTSLVEMELPFRSSRKMDENGHSVRSSGGNNEGVIAMQ